MFLENILANNLWRVIMIGVFKIETTINATCKVLSKLVAKVYYKKGDI